MAVAGLPFTQCQEGIKMKAFLSLMVFFASNLMAVEINPSLIIKEGVKIELMNLPSNYNAVCSMVYIHSPEYLSFNKEFSEQFIDVEVFNKEDELILSTTLIPEKQEEGGYVSSSCLPVDSSYRIKLTLNYSQPDTVFGCTEKLTISDLSKWISRKE